mgnify:CR=1 FL=1
MLKTRIIPCLDVADGRVVKGINFVDLRDAGDPVDAARAYADKKGIAATYIPTPPKTLKLQAYADNFR